MGSVARASSRIAATALEGRSGSPAASARAPTSSPVRRARAAASAVAAVHPPVARSSAATSAGPTSSPKPARHNCNVSSGRSARSAALSWTESALRNRAVPAGRRRARTTRRWPACSCSARRSISTPAPRSAWWASSTTTAQGSPAIASSSASTAPAASSPAPAIAAAVSEKPACATAARSRAAKSWADTPPSCKATSIATECHASTSSAPKTVLPYPAPASTTTTLASRHCEVSRGRRMWCAGRRLTSRPLFPCRQLFWPAACEECKSEALPACAVRVTLPAESWPGVSCPCRTEGKAGAHPA